MHDGTVLQDDPVEKAELVEHVEQLGHGAPGDQHEPPPGGGHLAQRAAVGIRNHRVERDCPVVVAGKHVNVHDPSEVAWRATGNIDPKRDIMLLEGPMDDLDHAALRHRYGGKMGIDATEKSSLDDVAQTWPEEIVMSEEIRQLVSRRWKDYGF